MAELLHDLPHCTVQRVFVSDMNNAVYLITSKSSGEQILIDAADDPAALLELLGEQPRLRHIVTTHAHWDHTRATAELARATGAQVAIGSADAPQLEAERGVTADRLLAHGDTVHITDVSLEVIALRGHTPGSVALLLSDGDGDSDNRGDTAPHILFTGDSLFPGGVGNTDNDPERFTQLFTDVTTRVFDRFGDDTVVYPGHGERTTLGAERPHLDEWKARGW